MKNNNPRQGRRIARSRHDNNLDFVGVATTKTTEPDNLGLPRDARLPINRCSLPASILGSLTYQLHPVLLALDGVIELHRALFERLGAEADPLVRAGIFQRHMAAAFSLDLPEEAGYSGTAPHGRPKANYLRIVRGWAFDSDALESAVLKGWVESRFGLLTRYHGGPIRDFSGETYRHFLEMRAKGLYGTNALEAQLDLLYSYCQYELGRQRPGETHLTLYRGVNHAREHEVLQERGPGRRRVLLNNLSSFTSARERAGEFGDYIMEVSVPLPKVFFMHRLLPGQLKGEDEFMVIGGVYEVSYRLI
jgi:NAD+---dinitrogen-reductase ADP-D-ribosyltransferase